MPFTHISMVVHRVGAIISAKCHLLCYPQSQISPTTILSLSVLYGWNDCGVTTQREKSKIFLSDWPRSWQQHLTIFTILEPKCCKYPLLGSKSSRGDIRLYFKTYEKKNSRWRHHWHIWHLSIKTKISLLLGCPQGFLVCQKMRHYPLILDFEIWCSNIQPKLKKTVKLYQKSVIFDSFWGFLGSLGVSK